MKPKKLRVTALYTMTCTRYTDFSSQYVTLKTAQIAFNLTVKKNLNICVT